MFAIRNSDPTVASSTHVFHFLVRPFFVLSKLLFQTKVLHLELSQSSTNWNQCSLHSTIRQFLSETSSLPTRPIRLSSNGILTRLYNLYNLKRYRRTPFADFSWFPWVFETIHAPKTFLIWFLMFLRRHL